MRNCAGVQSDILSRLVNDLSKIARGGQPGEFGATPGQEQPMKTKGLECLVSILRCMVEWSKDLYVSPNTLSNLSQYSMWLTVNCLDYCNLSVVYPAGISMSGGIDKTVHTCILSFVSWWWKGMVL